MLAHTIPFGSYEPMVDVRKSVDAFWPKTAPLKSRVSGPQKNRRSFVGGSDARIIMGDDEKALVPALAGKAG